MDDNKQIIDMTLDIMNVTSFTLELSGAIATDLYEKGWRKSSDIALKYGMSNDLWKMRTRLVELYQKYRNKADEHGLTEEKQMFYQGRAEAIWEGIDELDELRKKYKTYEETSKKYFTQEEVSKMSSKEVRENYADILRSMKDWDLR